MSDPVSPEVVALNRVADGLAALVAELRRGDAKTVKRVRTVARKVTAGLTHVPTDIDRAAAKRALRGRQAG